MQINLRTNTIDSLSSNFVLFRALCLFLLLVHCSISMYGQEDEIVARGTVFSDGRPLKGANILLKNKNLGTKSGVDGTFEINAEAGDLLTVSYVGMQTTEIAVRKDGKALIIRLLPKTVELKEGTG